MQMQPFSLQRPLNTSQKALPSPGQVRFLLGQNYLIMQIESCTSSVRMIALSSLDFWLEPLANNFFEPGCCFRNREVIPDLGSWLAVSSP